MFISGLKPSFRKGLVAAMLVLVCCTSCGGYFGESHVRVLYANTGKPISDAVVYAEYMLKPQPGLLARLLSGLDHRSYSPICVATRLTSTATNGAYELAELTREQKKHSVELAKKHWDFFGESTKKVMYKEYYKEGMERVPCEDENMRSNVVCMSESTRSDDARLEQLNLLGIVKCYGKHAMLFNERLYKEAKSLSVNYQDDREIYPGSKNGPTFGRYKRIYLESIKNRAYHPEKTQWRGSIFTQIEQ